MNRNQPAAVIAAQQKLLEAASRQVTINPRILKLPHEPNLKLNFQNLQNNAELQQKLQLLGKQVAAAAAANQGSGTDMTHFNDSFL